MRGRRADRRGPVVATWLRWAGGTSGTVRGLARSGGRAALSWTRASRRVTGKRGALTGDRRRAGACVAAPVTRSMEGGMSMADHDRVACVQVFGLIAVASELPRYASGFAHSHAHFRRTLLQLGSRRRFAASGRRRWTARPWGGPRGRAAASGRTTARHRPGARPVPGAGSACFPAQGVVRLRAFAACSACSRAAVWDRRASRRDGCRD